MHFAWGRRPWPNRDAHHLRGFGLGPPTIIAGHSPSEAVVSTNPYREMCEGYDGIFTANTGRTSDFSRSVGDCSWRLDEPGNLISKSHPDQKPPARLIAVTARLLLEQFPTKAARDHN